MKPKNINWVPTFGECVVENGVLRYSPSWIDGPNGKEIQVCLARSNLEFENGSITFRAVLHDQNSSAQLVLSHISGGEIFAGANIGGANYGIATYENGRWGNYKVAAYGAKPPINEDIFIKVSVTGSEVTVTVNGVIVASGSYQVRRGQIGVFMNGSQNIEVEVVSVEKEESIAFVVMQFTKEFDVLYEEVIVPTCNKFGLSPVRADDIYNNGLIIHDIEESIRGATLVIADITPDNPNVFYELGFAHGLAKPVVLLAEKSRGKLPFDVSGFRTIFYENSIGGKSLVEKTLTKHLENLLPNHFVNLTSQKL